MIIVKLAHTLLTSVNLHAQTEKIYTDVDLNEKLKKKYNILGESANTVPQSNYC